MLRISRLLCIGGLASLVAGQVWAQVPLQSLKDIWVGTPADLYQVGFDGQVCGTLSAPCLVLRTPRPEAVSRSFESIAFGAPVLGLGGTSSRDLIAADGTHLLRYENGTDKDVAAQTLFEADGQPSQLKSITAVAVPETNPSSQIFAGYSKPKRTYEIYQRIPGKPQPIQMRDTGRPALTDLSYVSAEDVPAGSLLAGGGLIATVGKEVLFYPAALFAPDNVGPADTAAEATKLLIDTKALGIKGNVQLLSADLVRKTNVLLVATSERTIVMVALDGSAAPQTFASLNAACANVKPQRVLVRSARGGSEASVAVLDASCATVLRYDFDSTTLFSQPAQTPDATVASPGYLVLAVGEGNAVHCEPSDPTCSLTGNSEITTNINSPVASDLLVLQYDDLCDPRILTAPCSGSLAHAVDGGYLNLNEVLPPSVGDTLYARGVTLMLPPYMSSSSHDGRFGMLLVQTDPLTAVAGATLELEYTQLANQVKLGVAMGLPRPTTTLTLLNQDVAAYAPDSPTLPTVRGFEATPITTGFRNPMTGGIRGFSAIIYSLQHDKYPTSSRRSDPNDPSVGGILGPLSSGSSPSCPDLAYGQQVFPVITSQEVRYFANLSACLFSDLEALVTTWIPAAAWSGASPAGAKDALLAKLGNTKDKLIKALLASGPNSGSENFQSVLSQLDNFDAQVAATGFQGQYKVYRNELEVRSKVFRFNLIERTLPSLPIGGLPPP